MEDEEKLVALRKWLDHEIRELTEGLLRVGAVSTDPAVRDIVAKHTCALVVRDRIQKLTMGDD